MTVNPYNFVKFAKTQDVHEPDAHDRTRPGTLTGTITVTLQAATGVLFLDDSTKQQHPQGDAGHFLYSTRQVGGRVAPAITSIKGSLRSAYEAVTNSRMGVFGEHSQQLGERLPARAGAGLLPARLVRGEAGWELLVLRGDGDDRGHRAVAAAFVSTRLICSLSGLRSPQEVGRSDELLARYLAADGLQVEAELCRVKHKQFDGWYATRVCPQGTRDWFENEVPRGWGLGGATQRATGYLMVTGPGTARRKHEERLAFDTRGEQRLPLTPEIESMWKAVIKSYLDANGLDANGRLRAKDGSQNGVHPAAHLLDPKRRELYVEGRMLYVRMDKGRVTEVHPVAIGRRLFDRSPRQITPDQVLPITRLADATPADRLFGFVAASKTQRSLDQAFAGRLRIRSIDATEASVREPVAGGVSLEVLGGPKPSQWRFYTRSQGQGGSQGYSHTDELRGRKVYWHHRDWKPSGTLRKAVVNDRGESMAQSKQRDNQNRSVADWLQTGSKVTLQLEVRAADRGDVAALVWLLKAASGENPAHLRMGYGKPLGFGSFSVSGLDCRLLDHDHVSQRWASLQQPTSGILEGSAAIDELAAEFRRGEPAAESPLGQYLRVARGIESKRIDYPRPPSGTDESAKRPIYEWFRGNNTQGTALPEAHSNNLDLPGT